MRFGIDARALTAAQKTGVGVVADALIRAMATLGSEHEFVLFATGSEEALTNIPAYREANITTSFVQIPNKIANALWSLPKSVPMERLVSGELDAWLFPNAHVFSTRLPYVVVLHDAAIRTVPDCFTIKDHLRAWIANEPYVFHHAQKVIAVSEHSKRDAVALYELPESQIIAAPLGVDHTIFTAREQPSDRSYRAAYDLNRPYILWLATREPRKNVDAIIRAYDMFRASGGTAIPLVLAGGPGWKTQHILRAKNASPFAQDIREIASLPEKHKPALFRGASAFVFPSLYEGFGLPVLEAMACGVPVITSISSSLPEVTSDAAILIDPLNVSDLTTALRHLFDPTHGSALRASLQEKGRARAKTFSWDTIAFATLSALIETRNR